MFIIVIHMKQFIMFICCVYTKNLQRLIKYRGCKNILYLLSVLFYLLYCICAKSKHTDKHILQNQIVYKKPNFLLCYRFLVRGIYRYMISVSNFYFLFLFLFLFFLFHKYCMCKEINKFKI